MSSQQRQLRAPLPTHWMSAEASDSSPHHSSMTWVRHWTLIYKFPIYKFFLFRAVHLHKLCVLAILHPLGVHAAPVWGRGKHQSPAAESARYQWLWGDQGPVHLPHLQPQIRLCSAVHSKWVGPSSGLQTQASLYQVPGQWLQRQGIRLCQQQDWQRQTGGALRLLNVFRVLTLFNSDQWEHSTEHWRPHHRSSIGGWCWRTYTTCAAQRYLFQR